MLSESPVDRLDPGNATGRTGARV